MKRIVIDAVSQHGMRPPYDASEAGGDWFMDPHSGELRIRVIGDNLDTPETFLFALHELCEAALCRARGIEQAAVDRFDALFEAEREAGAHADDAEPGDDPRAPYQKEHRAAMLIEHLMAQFLGYSDYGTVR